MAEIEIEKKKPIWPWIVGLLILAAIIYFLFFMNKDDNDRIDDGATTSETEQVSEENNADMEDTAAYSNIAEVEDYTNYIGDSKMGVDHEYTHGALVKLIAATRATAEAVEVNVDSDLTLAKEKTEEITKDPSKLTHANKIKESGQIISRALRTIQTDKFPDLQSEYDEVETAISKIEPDKQTLEQKDAVKAFFSEAEQLLTSINNNHGQGK